MYSLPLATAVLTLFITWLAVYFWKRNRKLPPGPWGLPVLGYYPFLTSRPYMKFVELAKTYGNIFSFRTSGGNLIVVVNGAKKVKEIFVNRTDEIIGRPRGSNLVSWSTDGLGITQEEGADWREQRRFFLQTAKTLGFGKSEMEDLLHEEVRGFIQDLRETNGTSTDIKHSLAYATGSVATRLLFSTKFQKNDRRFQDMYEGLVELLKLFISNVNFLVGPYFDLSLWLRSDMSKIQQGKKHVYEVANFVIEQHVKSFDVNNPKDLVDEFLKLMHDDRKKGGNSFTHKRLQAAVINIFIDGVESVTTAITLLLLELSKYPDAQSRIQKELDAIVGQERLPSWLDRQNMPYFEAVIQELWRFSAPVAVTTLYSNLKDMTIDNYTIPKRSILVANLWSANNDPELYKNPEEFKPERFLSTDGKRDKRDGPYPFGLGKRSCAGESLAQMEVFVFLGSILQNFCVLPGNSDHELRMVPRD
ncbi:cytochrome P450 18a1-like [Uloborus diversus]|uniref:cytochrome P450 18a1-like n=1 Tax=Uloborus diversus TaxID=327109 RepID=UPI00240930DD|nr:cytochrome P450 18a1-like [Uloborus diversus]